MGREHRGFEVMAMLCCVLNVTGVTRVYPFATTLTAYNGFMLLYVIYVSRKMILKYELPISKRNIQVEHIFVSVLKGQWHIMCI